MLPPFEMIFVSRLASLNIHILGLKQSNGSKNQSYMYTFLSDIKGILKF